MLCFSGACVCEYVYSSYCTHLVTPSFFFPIVFHKVMYGGQHSNASTAISFVFADLWAFNIDTHVWEWLEGDEDGDNDSPPFGTTGAMASVVSDNFTSFIVYGGLDVIGSTSDSQGTFGIVYPGCRPGYFSPSFFTRDWCVFCVCACVNVFFALSCNCVHLIRQSTSFYL